MSETVDAAVKALNARLEGESFDGTAKFVVEDEGTIWIDETGAAAGDGDAECTMTASAETFEGILQGNIDPTSAFMSGRLGVDGDIALALKLANILR